MRVSPGRTMLVVGFVALALPAVAQAASYMKLGDIKGEAVQAKRAVAGQGRAPQDHKGEIEIQSFSWGTNNAGSSASTSARAVAPRDAASGLATGKRQHKPMTFIKPADTNAGSVTVAASLPECRVGTVYSTVELGDSGTGESVTLHDAAVSACAAESVSFTYAKVQW